MYNDIYYHSRPTNLSSTPNILFKVLSRHKIWGKRLCCLRNLASSLMRGSLKAETKNNNESEKKEGKESLPYTRITRANMFEYIEIVFVCFSSK